MSVLREYITAMQILKKKFPVEYEAVYTIMSKEKAKDKDIKQVPGYYDRFCTVNEILGIERAGAIGDRANTEYRRLFVGCMLDIYSPGTFIGSPVIVFGLGRQLADLFDVRKSAIYFMIDQVVFNYRMFPEFKQLVSDNVEKILPRGAAVVS